MRKIISFIAIQLVVNGLFAQEFRQLIAEANARASKHQDAKAAQLLKKAIRITNPNEIDLYLVFTNLGAVQQRMHKNKDALASYNSALKLKPTSLFALNNRGVLKMGLNDYQGALADFGAAIQFDSLKEDAYINRSYLYKHQKDTAAAIKDLKRALRLKPYNAAARNSYADVLMCQGKLDEALKICAGLLDEFPHQPQMLNNMAEVYIRMKKYDQAMTYVNQAINVNAAFDAAYIVRAEIYLAAGDQKAAKKDLKKASSIGNKNPKIEKMLSSCR